MNKPRIAFLHYTAPPVIGGVEFVLKAQAIQFHQHGYPVKILAGRGKKFSKGIGMEIFPLLGSQHPEIIKVNRLLSQGKCPANFEKIVDEISKFLTKSLRAVDIIIAHNISTMHFNLSFTQAFNKYVQQHSGKVFVAWVHDHTFANEAYKNFWRQSFPYNLITRPIFGLNYVTISLARQELLVRLLGLKKSEIAVIPDGIEIEKFLDLSPRTCAIIDRFNLLKQDLVMFTPVRILKRKNFELGIKVVRSLKSQKKKVKLIITGPTDPHNLEVKKYFCQLKNLSRKLRVKKEVIFLSQYGIQVDYFTLRSLYRVCDILFLPSFQEGFGLPLLEAGLSRQPIICSAIPPLQVLGGKDVLYFSPEEDARKIARRILRVLENNSVSRMFRKTLRGYSWSAIFEKKIQPYITRLLQKNM